MAGSPAIEQRYSSPKANQDFSDDDAYCAAMEFSEDYVPPNHVRAAADTIRTNLLSYLRRHPQLLSARAALKPGELASAEAMEATILLDAYAHAIEVKESSAELSRELGALRAGPEAVGRLWVSKRERQFERQLLRRVRNRRKVLLSGCCGLAVGIFSMMLGAIFPRIDSLDAMLGKGELQPPKTTSASVSHIDDVASTSSEQIPVDLDSKETRKEVQNVLPPESTTDASNSAEPRLADGEGTERPDPISLENAQEPSPGESEPAYPTTIVCDEGAQPESSGSRERTVSASDTIIHARENCSQDGEVTSRVFEGNACCKFFEFSREFVRRE